MTPPRSPAGHAGRILVRADETDVDILSQVIAEAFFDLPPSRWLVAGPGHPPRDLPRLLPALRRARPSLRARAHNPAPRRRRAVAARRPGSPGPPSDYRARLAAITGPLAARFEAFDAALEARHPVAVPHQHLAILAVRPGQQGHGTGTALLAARHAALDAEGIPAFLQASSPDSRRLYLRHGYIDYGPRIELPGGPALDPMWRQPHDPQDAGRQQ